MIVSPRLAEHDAPKSAARIGLIAYGSLQWDPGELADILDFGTRIEGVQTPFRVEFARSSSKRGGGPTLIPVETGGAVSAAPVIAFREAMSIQHAETLVWKRETGRTDGHYEAHRNHGPNKVYVDAYEVLYAGFDVVLAVRIGSNIEDLSASNLANLAIRSAQIEHGERRADGISYLIDAKRCGIETPLQPAYEGAAIVQKLGVGTLEEAWQVVRGGGNVQPV